jgi:hypothetical protein
MKETYMVNEIHALNEKCWNPGSITNTQIVAAEALAMIQLQTQDRTILHGTSGRPRLHLSPSDHAVGSNYSSEILARRATSGVQESDSEPGIYARKFKPTAEISGYKLDLVPEINGRSSELAPELHRHEIDAAPEMTCHREPGHLDFAHDEIYSSVVLKASDKQTSRFDPVGHVLEGTFGKLFDIWLKGQGASAGLSTKSQEKEK